MTEQQRLSKALKALGKIGYEVTSANSEAYQHSKYVSLRSASWNTFNRDGSVKKCGYLKWYGDVDEILEVLHKHGIDADWSGKSKKSPIRIFSIIWPEKILIR